MDGEPLMSRVYESVYDSLLLCLVPVIIILEGLKPCWFKMIHLKQRAFQCHGDSSSHRMKSEHLKTGRFLGQGCSGMIYEATKNRTLLARKAFPSVPASDFEIEAARLVDLESHPNIVETLGWTVDQRSCSLIMEYMRYDLFSVLQKKKEDNLRNSAHSRSNLPVQTTLNPSVNNPFQLEEAVDILSQIAAGMEYVHGKGFAHGDLKPNNVLVDSESGSMLVKVVDFGLIQTKRRSTSLVSDSARCLQIVTWKAPELFEDYFGVEDTWTEASLSDFEDAMMMPSASNLQALQWADIYSFALICLFVFGGQFGHLNKSVFEIRKGIFSGTRPNLPAGIPQVLKDLVVNCWDPNPQRRPSFSKICEELKSFKTKHFQIGGTIVKYLIPKFRGVCLPKSDKKYYMTDLIAKSGKKLSYNIYDDIHNKKRKRIQSKS